MFPLNPDSFHLSPLVFIVARPGYEHRAELLSSTLKLPALDCEKLAETDEGLALIVDEGGLSLQQLGRKAPGPVRCDFVGGASRHRRLYGGGKGQDIAKAVGVSHKGFRPKILDLTAGLGRDGFVLASMGATLLMLERHPVVLALLEDGIARARAQHESDSALSEVMSRMTTLGGDGRDYLNQLKEDDRPDVVYLDPMFPSREKSGKVKKEMQLFHQLVGTDDDSASLLELSLQQAIYRVVVKRPSHAPFLADKQPGYSLKGKSTRFDIYPIKKLPD